MSQRRTKVASQLSTMLYLLIFVFAVCLILSTLSLGVESPIFGTVAVAVSWALFAISCVCALFANKKLNNRIISVISQFSQVGEKEELEVTGADELTELIEKINTVKAQLNAKESMASGIIDTAVDSIITIDKDRAIISYNNAAELMFGYRRDEVIGKNVKILMPDKYAREHDDYVLNYIRTGEKKVIGHGREVEGKRKDGSTFPIHLSLGDFWVGEEQFFAGIARDISAEVELRNQISYEKERTSGIIDTAVDAIITIDEKRIVQSFNSGAVSMFGYKADEVVGENIKKIMPDEYAKEHDQYVANYINTGEKKVIGKGREVEGLRKDGSTFPLYLSIGEMYVNGKRYFTGIARDITVDVEMRNKIRKAQQESSDLVQHMDERIAQYRKLLEQISSGDLSERLLVGDSTDDLSRLGEHLNGMTDGLAEIATKISSVTVELGSSIKQVQNTAIAQASSATQQASSVNETTTIIEEIRTTSKQTLDKVSALGENAEKTQVEGKRGLDAVEHAVSGMKRIRNKVEAIAESILALSDKTQMIGETTEAVGGLAQQSKLLALNASIEAAKAGEAGKGFAVVASEVKALAEQSQQATEKVQKILQDIQLATDKAVMATEEGNKEVDSGIQAVEQTGQVVHSLSDVIQDSVISAQQIVAAVQQESIGIEQIAEAMTEINKVTSQFVAASEQSKQTAQSLGEVVSQLSDAAAMYKTEQGERRLN